jgi:hypothetical protein
MASRLTADPEIGEAEELLRLLGAEAGVGTNE